MIQSRLNTILFLIFLFNGVLKVYSQCSDTIKLNIDPIKNKSDFLLYPKERDTSSLAVNNPFYISCNLPDGNWHVKYKGSSKKYLSFKIKNKKIEGSCVCYYLNGHIESHIKFKNNIRNGNANFYYSTGFIKVKSKWKNGNRNKKWKYYNQEGKIYHIKVYKNGKLISEKIFHEQVPDEIKEWYNRN